jgi:hypothetical protein
MSCHWLRQYGTNRTSGGDALKLSRDELAFYDGFEAHSFWLQEREMPLGGSEGANAKPESSGRHQ